MSGGYSICRARPWQGSRLAPASHRSCCAGHIGYAIDAEGRIYTLDHTGDWYVGPDIDQALTTLIAGVEPQRLTTQA